MSDLDLLFQVSMQNIFSAITVYFWFHAPIDAQFEPWMNFTMNDLDLYLTYCSKLQWMEIVPVPTCCKWHAHNYTSIPNKLRRRGTLDPSGQLVNIYVTQHQIKIESVAATCFDWNPLYPEVKTQSNIIHACRKNTLSHSISESFRSQDLFCGMIIWV